MNAKDFNDFLMMLEKGFKSSYELGKKGKPYTSPFTMELKRRKRDKRRRGRRHERNKNIQLRGKGNTDG